jgi:hypothetical protein
MCFNKLFKFVILIILLVSFAVFSGCGGTPVTPPIDNNEVVVQEILSMHDLAEQKLNVIVEGPGIDTEGTLNILGEYLNEQTGVESTVIDGNLLQINYTSGFISFILLQDINTEPTFGGNIVRENTLSIPFYFRTAATNVLEVKSDLNNSSIQITKDLDDVIYTGNRDVLIWAPFAAEYNTWGCEQWSCDVISEFDNRFENSNLNFNITTLENEKADVDALQNITDYGGMVIFITHGGGKGKWLITGEVVDTSWYLGGYNPYYEGWLLAKHMAVWQDMKVKGEGGVLVSKPVYAVNSSWFNSNLSGNFSNTIILNISCYSAKTDDLWNVFKDKSAGAYFGFTDVTSGGFGLTQGWDLIEKLRGGDLTTGEAYQPEFDPYYPSLWLLKGNYNLKFPRDTILTPEEIELIREWGYGGNYVARWPNGYVDVYDATNYSQMQEVLNQWNATIGGSVILRLSSNPNSPVKVIFDSSLGGLDLCGSGDPVWGDDYAFSEVVIKVNPDEYTCETYNTNTKYCLYLVMFTGVAGFNYGAEVESTPFEIWSNFNTISDTIKTMIHALYKVPPGYYLGESKQRKDRSNSVIKNVFTSGGVNCLDE